MNKAMKGARPSSIVLCLVSIGVMLAMHIVAEQSFETTERNRNDYFVPSVDGVKLCSLGFDQFLSDMYWLAFVQYCGEPDPHRGEPYRKAYDYVNLITSLDPHFARPYWFGCWAIGYWQQRPDLADKILRRGIAANPKDWDLPFLAGVNQYIFGHDAKAAAVYYEQAAKLPGAPDYLARQAVILRSPAPDFYKRMHILYQALHNAEEPTAKAAYRAELIKLTTELYYKAPNQKIRDACKAQLEGLGGDVSTLKPISGP
jgi:hypothetical protein